MIEDKVQAESDKARNRARRKQLEEEVTRIVTSAADLALKDLGPEVEALRQEIAAQTIGQTEVDDLTAAVDGASGLVVRGEALLS